MTKRIIDEKRLYGRVSINRVEFEARLTKSASELADLVSLMADPSTDPENIKLLDTIDNLQSKLSAVDHQKAIDDALSIAYSKGFDELLRQQLRDVMIDDKRFKKMSTEDFESVVEYNLPTSQKKYRKMVRKLTHIPAPKILDPVVHKALFGKANKMQDEVGKEIISILNDIIGESQFTAEQAAEKFENINIAGTGSRSIQASKFYNNKSFKSDCIEFFRLANGNLKLKKVHHTAKQRRAHVIDYGEDTEMETGINFRRSIAWHELGHLVEFSDKTILNKSIDLLQRRLDNSASTGANGGGIQRLSKLTGSRAYGRSEIAIDDGFVSYYAGKVYQDAGGKLSNLTATELISTGFELLSDEKAAARFLSIDPEHFKLVMLAIKGLHK